MKQLFVLALCLQVTSSLARAQPPPAPAAVPPGLAAVVLDTTSSALTRSTNKSYFFAQVPASVQLALDAAANSPNGVDLPTARALGHALSSAAGSATNRLITAAKAPPQIAIYVIYDLKGDPPALSIEEVERKTQLATDSGILIQMIKELAFAAEPVVGVRREVYQLTKPRASLTCTASQTVGGQETKAETVVTTGPTEHLFLSADVPLNSINKLEYDDASAQLVERDPPETFYVGLDYQLGDLLSPRRGGLKGLVLKGLLQMSKRPQDSFGVAVGYRVPDLSLLGLSLNTFSPFAGVVWTREDRVTAEGEPRRNAARTRDYVVGISLNLDRAMGWLKK